VVRAFVRLREALAAHKELAKRLDDLERVVGEHGEAITEIVGAIRILARFSGRNPARVRRWCDGECPETTKGPRLSPETPLSSRRERDLNPRYPYEYA